MSSGLRLRPQSPPGYQRMVGVGGIGSGIFFALEGEHTLGRDESRLGRLLEVRDYCKLHIISHYVARLLGGGFQVIPVGKVGDDAPGRQMIREMQAAGMDTGQVEMVAGAPTLFSVCFQYPEGVGGNITTSNSAAAQLSAEDVDKVEHLFAEPAIALAAPEVPLETRAHFLKAASQHGAFRAAAFSAAEVAPALEMGLFANLDLVSLNEGEAAVLAGRPFDPENPQPYLRACERNLAANYPELRLAVTAGALGAFGYCQGKWEFCPAPKAEVASTAGAGDALLGGLLAATVAGIPFVQTGSREPQEGGQEIASGLDLGVLLATYTVSSPHTIHPDANMEKLLAFAAGRGLSFSDDILGRLEGGGEAKPAGRS